MREKPTLCLLLTLLALPLFGQSAQSYDKDDYHPFLKSSKTILDSGFAPHDVDVSFVVNNRPVFHENVKDVNPDKLELDLYKALGLARQPVETPTPIVVATRPLADLNKARKLVAEAAGALWMTVNSTNIQIWYRPPTGYKATSKEQLDIMERLALLKYKQCNYEEAAKLLSGCVEFLKAQNGDETSEAADLYAHLGMVYRGSMVDNADVDHAKEDFEHSKSAYLKALTIRKKVLSPSHPELAATYSFLADLYDDRGANDEASKLRARGSRLMEDNNLQVTAFPLPSAIYPPRCNSWSDF